MFLIGMEKMPPNRKMKKIIIGEPITINFSKKKPDEFSGLNKELFPYQKDAIYFIDSDRGIGTKKGYAI